MLSATLSNSGNRSRLPSAGERRTALPFPDPWVLISTLLLPLNIVFSNRSRSASVRA